MFNLILYFMFLIFNCDGFSESGFETQVIRVSYISPNEAFRVMKEKPLKIIFEDNVIVLKECINSFRETQLPFALSTEFTKTTNNYIVVNVTNDMSTKWKCITLQEYHGPPVTIYKNKNYTITDVIFDIYVTSRFPAVSPASHEEVVLLVNNASLTVVPTNETSDHDAEAHYKYEDGEYIDYKCQQINYDQTRDELRLEYYDAQGRLIFRSISSQTRSEQTFYSLLKLEHNNYYLDCICTTFDPEREYRYRIYFHFSKQHLNPPKHPLTLYVNGERQLLRREQLDPSYDDYVPYKYIEGEQLNVTCKKDEAIEEGILFSFRLDAKTYVVNQSEKMLSFQAPGHDIEESLFCFIEKMVIEKGFARIDFKSAFPEFDVRILGLPRKNIMYQSTSGSKWTIGCQFSVEEIFDLTCDTKSGTSTNELSFRWISPDPYYLQDKHERADDDGIHKTILGPRRIAKNLKRSHNQSIIQCIDLTTGEMVEIVLYLKPELQSTDTTATNDTNDRNSTLTDNSTATDYNTMITIGVMSTVALIVTIIVIVVIATMINKRKTPQTQVPTPAIPPEPFYLNNLNLFRKECDQEIQQLEEHQYEEIDQVS